LAPNADSSNVKVSLFTCYDVAALCKRDIHGRKSNTRTAVMDQAQQSVRMCTPELHG
jgi:hypothetical protein